MAHLLDLKTLTERPTIGIDGAAYEMRTPDEISIVDAQRFQNYGQRISVLQSGQATEEQAREAHLAIDRLLDIVMVDLPQELRERLSDRQKGRIIEAFTKLFPEAARQAGGAKTARKANGKAAKTSASRSASSSTSTAGLPNSG